MLGCITVVLLGMLMPMTSGDADVFVLFEYYDNPDGTKSNGKCCDNWPLCAEGCDYYFRICLDDTNGLDSTKSCNYGYYRTNVAFNNQRSLVFGDDIGGKTNPFYFKIPGPIDKMVDLKVDIKDHDIMSQNDYVDFLRSHIWLHKGIFEKVQLPVDLIGRTRLNTLVTIQCSVNWYGEDCSTYCRRPSQDDHFTCDPSTGMQVCSEGWFGPLCNYRHNQERRQKTLVT